MCECECKNRIIVTTSQLTQHHTLSCGCLQRERASKANRKNNIYDLSGEYGIGYTTKGEEFWFDLEDYDKIKDYCWYFSHGYVMSRTKLKDTFLHSLVLNQFDKNIWVDHIEHNLFDNRKDKLRICTSSQNSMNQVLRIDNTSGVTGVYYNKKSNMWYSQIKVKGLNRITLGYFETKEEAILARKIAEEKYFGEYSYDNSIKKEVI